MATRGFRAPRLTPTGDATVDKFVRLVQSSDMQQVLTGLTELRDLLVGPVDEYAKRDQKPLDVAVHDYIPAIIKSGILPWVVDAMKVDNHDVRIMAATVLINVAAGDSNAAQALMEINILDELYLLLGTHNNTRFQGLCLALASNIAVDSSIKDDELIDSCLLEHARDLCQNKDASDVAITDAICTISDFLSRDGVRQHLDHDDIIELLISLLNGLDRLPKTEDRTLVIGLSVLETLLSHDNALPFSRELHQRVWNVTTPLIRDHNDKRVCRKALEALGSLALGDERDVTLLLDNNVLTVLKPLLQAHHDIAARCCWLLSNLVGENVTLQYRILNSGIMNTVVDIADELQNEKAGKEAMEVIIRFVEAADESQLHALLRLTRVADVVRKLILSCKNDAIVSLASEVENEFRTRCNIPSPELSALSALMED